MVARNNPHHFAALRIHTNRGTKRIHHINGLGLGKLPRPRRKGIRLAYKRAHRAQVNDITLQVAVERLTQIGSDFAVFAAARLAHLCDPSHLCREPYTTCARNAAGHVSFNQQTEVQIVRGTLWLAEAREIHAIGHSLVLQIALAALVTNRAIKRMVDQQELHHTLTGLFDHRRICLHNRRLPLGARAQITHLHSARGRRLWRAADNFHKTHTAVSCNAEALVIAKAWHFNASFFTGLNQRHRAVNFYLFFINDDLA